MKNVREILANNLVTARKKLGYSQMKLAELTDLSPGMIAQLEQAQVFPSSESLDRIADSLSLKPFQLFLEEEDRDAKEEKRFDLLTSLNAELKAKLSEQIDVIISNYLKNKKP